MPNLLICLAATVAAMVVGALWYGPLFGKMWMSMIGKTEEEITAGFNPAKTYGITALLWFVCAVLLAMLTQALGGDLMAGIRAATYGWIAFMLPMAFQTYSFEDRPLNLIGLNLGYNLVSLIVMGVIIGMWG